MIKKCGNCVYWMNYYVCPREKRDIQTGIWWGPSIETPACVKYLSKDGCIKESEEDNE